MSLAAAGAPGRVAAQGRRWRQGGGRSLKGRSVAGLQGQRLRCLVNASWVKLVAAPVGRASCGRAPGSSS